MGNEENSLVKVHIDLPNHWATGGESIWALPIGNDLYEIRNVPFYAYGINWGDTVRASSDDSELKPEVREVVKRSGNKTLRVFFSEELSDEAEKTILSALKILDVSWEQADKRYVAIDVHPEADYDAVCEKLSEIENQGFLEYETCEARVSNSFDDAPVEST